LNAQIAQHLNVVESAILEIQEWANVLWVRIKGVGARFVSKKVVKMDTLENFLSAIQIDQLIPDSVKKDIVWCEEVFVDEGLEPFLEERQYRMQNLIKSGEKYLSDRTKAKEAEAGILACKKYIELTKSRESI
jgi:hypothetical protein